MTTPVCERSEHSNAKPPHAQRKGLLVAFVSGAVLATAVAWYHWHPTSSVPKPPAVALVGVDAAIVRAVEHAQEALRATPQSAAAWGHLGMVLLTHDFTAEAKACFLQAEQLDRGEPRWPYYLGVAEHEDDPNAAIAQLQRAVALFDETRLPPRLRLAEELLGQDRFAEAEVQLGHILQHDPHHAYALLTMSRLALRQGRVQEALDFGQRCRRVVGPSKSISLLLAEIYQQLGDKAAAANQSRQAVALRDDPPRPDPLVEELVRIRTGERANLKRAQNFLDAGRVAQAVPLLQQLVWSYPDSSSSWFTLGRALARQQQWAASDEALAKALQLAPDNPEIHVQRGINWYFQGNPRAEEAFRQAIQRKPDCAPAYYNLGLWLAKQHRAADAIDAFQAAVRIQPDLADAYLGLGSQFASTGQFPEAVRSLRRAVELNPADQRAKQLLKQALVRIAASMLP